MRYRLSFLTSALAALTVALTAAADGYDVVGKPDLTFTAVGPGGLKINGTTVDLKTMDDGTSVVFKASLKDIKTGIGLRDKHLRDYLECDRYPDATLVVDRAKISMPKGAGPASGTVDGALTLHGVTHPARVSYRIAPEGSGFHVGGDLDVNILDYGIKKPCYLGVCTGDHVKVTADFTVQGS
jgi:polyisoprenoid-binding protein YceI